MPDKLSAADLETAIKLLKKNSSINAVSAYLKRRNLKSSAPSWDALLNQRIVPALESGDLDRADILQLLRESEEYGRQHVFLFRCSKINAASYVDTASIRASLNKLDLETLMDRPRIVNRVPGLQIVEVRIEKSSNGNHLIVKLVDTRRYKTMVSRLTEGNREVVTYELDEERAINVLRIGENGLTEVRIQAHRNAVDYNAQAEAVFDKLAGVIDRLHFEDFLLGKARRYMLENRSKLASILRFGEGVVISKKGAPITFATANWNENMFGDDEEVEAAMTTLLASGGGRSKCNTVNCTWLKLPDNAGPASDVHTFIGGRSNEFHILPHCERSDYLYVLEKITSFAK